MILDEFFGAEFEGGRHQARVDMIHGIEADYTKLEYTIANKIHRIRINYSK